MAMPPSHVYTISHVANMLGEDEELLWKIGGDMFSEHGCMRVFGIGEEGVMAFTDAGIENLRVSIIDMRESMKKK